MLVYAGNTRESLGPVVVIAFIYVFIFRNYIHRLTPCAIKKCAGNERRETHRFCLGGARIRRQNKKARDRAPRLYR